MNYVYERAARLEREREEAARQHHHDTVALPRAHKHLKAIYAALDPAIYGHDDGNIWRLVDAQGCGNDNDGWGDPTAHDIPRVMISVDDTAHVTAIAASGNTGFSIQYSDEMTCVDFDRPDRDANMLTEALEGLR